VRSSRRAGHRRHEETKADTGARLLRARPTRRRAGESDPVVGPPGEIEQNVRDPRATARKEQRRSDRPRPAVGKTAIAEVSRADSNAGGVPQPLSGARLVALELSGMIAGAQFRGLSFEEAVQAAPRGRGPASSEGQDRPIIDELHTVSAPATPEGAMDAPTCSSRCRPRPSCA